MASGLVRWVFLVLIRLQKEFPVFALDHYTGHVGEPPPGAIELPLADGEEPPNDDVVASEPGRSGEAEP